MRPTVWAAATLLLSAPVVAQTPPLQITRQDFFYAGGQRTEDGKSIVDQMSVEHQIPARQTAAYPVIMMHDNYQNGTNFLGTSYDRTDWATWFLRHG